MAPNLLDLFSQRVIGWAMATNQDETLIETAFCMALLGRHPATGLLFHSDRGSQYTGDAYRAVLAESSITVSMSRTGNCYDNAVTESFFGTRDQVNVWNACLSRRAGRPGKPSSSMSSASTTEFGGTPHSAM